jgi:hypothetical protein
LEVLDAVNLTGVVLSTLAGAVNVHVPLFWDMLPPPGLGGSSVHATAGQIEPVVVEEDVLQRYVSTSPTGGIGTPEQLLSCEWVGNCARR